MLDTIKKFYSSATRTTLLVQEKASKEWYHIFSVIELQPIEAYPYNIPKPSAGWVDNSMRSRGNKSHDYTFYLTIDRIDSIDNVLTIFNNSFTNYTIGEERIKFYNSSFCKEPAGNYPFVFPPNTLQNEGLPVVLPKR
jgi:hypothetical protein